MPTHSFKKLSEICKILKGKNPELFSDESKNSLPYLSAKFIRGTQSPEFALISDKKSVSVDKNEIIIICDGSNSGESFIGFSGILSSTMGKIVHNKEIQNLYLKYFLDVIVDELRDKKTGTAIPHLDIKRLLNSNIPLPPLSDQEEIVEKLDKALASIDEAKTKTQQGLAATRELWESTLKNLLSDQKNKIEGTVEQLIKSDFLFKPLDGNHGEIHPTKKDFKSNGIPFIMASDLSNGSVDTKNCKFISKETAQGLRTGFAQNGDVLLSHKATIGRVAILDTSLEYVVLTPQVTFYRIKNTQKLHNRYLYYYLQSRSFQKEMFGYAEAGSTRAYIGITKQLQLHLSFPESLAEQSRIVTHLDAVRVETGKLVSLYEQKLRDLDKLRRSVLQEAFTLSD